jgi:ribosome biogenesis GTPase
MSDVESNTATELVADDAPAIHGVVLGGTGGVWQVRKDDGQTVDASMRGRLKKSNSGKRADGSLRRDTIMAAMKTLKLAVGDDVLLEQPQGGETWAIGDILPRRSQLARRAPGGGQGQRIVAANVDQVVIMFAAAKPEPHPRMLDRFLVIAEGNELPARIIINKVDLVGEEAAHQRFDPYRRAGYEVHYTAVKGGLGLEAARAMLVGRRSVLTGPSGVGKSSLVNALFPGANLRVGAISESVNKGQHTTVGAVMLPLPGDDGYVIDTPGLREVGLWALDAEQLDRCFPEIRSHRDDCRFADCSHIVEPDCAVREALGKGEISPERYDSYLKLLEELRGQK